MATLGIQWVEFSLSVKLQNGYLNWKMSPEPPHWKSGEQQISTISILVDRSLQSKLPYSSLRFVDLIFAGEIWPKCSTQPEGKWILFFFFIPKICRISRRHSFQCCLPYCFKGVISICMIATVHKSLVLTGFLQHDVEKNFCKKRGGKSHCEGLLYDSSCQSRLIFFFFFWWNVFMPIFPFYPKGKDTIISIFFWVFVLGEKSTHIRHFIADVAIK